jgi:glucose-6-phosphate 1-epimerase
VTDIHDLNTRFGKPGAVGFVDHRRGGPVVELTSPHGQAEVALLGGLVMNWRPQGQGEVLWLSSPGGLDGSGRVPRGGIPVCWPWFADHPTDPSLPAHGFARTAMWEVASTDATSDDVRLMLRTDVGATGNAPWPHRAELKLEVRLGARLDVRLTTRNVGAAPFELTQALHTYFRVGEVTRVAVRGLDGVSYLDKLNNFAARRQSGPISVDREVDRIYFGTTGPIDLVDPVLGRTIRVTRSGSTSAVVWNPWIAKAARLGDVIDAGGSDAYRRMLCIEAANAASDAVTIAPGGTHTLGTGLEVMWRPSV